MLDALNAAQQMFKVHGRSVAASGNTLYVTIPGWPNFATLDHIYITANNAVENLTVAVLNSVGEVANATDLGLTYGSVVTSLPGGIFNFNDLFVEDLYRTNCLHLKLSASSITEDTVFNIVAFGKQRKASHIAAQDYSNVISDASLKMFTKDADDKITDFKKELVGNGNPYGYWGGKQYVILPTADDEFFLGSFGKIEQLYIQKPNWEYTTGVSEIAYWDGDSWAALADANMIDGTSDNQSSPTHLAHTGVLRIIAPNDWTPAIIDEDPMTAIVAEIEENVNRYHDKALPPQILIHGPRYWLRFKATDVPFALNGIVKIKTAMRP